MPENDPLWYKDAIIYEVHVRAFSDSFGDGHGDFPGPDPEARLPAGPGDHGDLALAVLSVAAEGRRLRHRRLHEHPPALRQRSRTSRPFWKRPTNAASGSSPSWCSTTRRTSIPGSSAPACRRRQPGTRLLRLERHPREVPGRPGHLQGLRAVELELGSGRQGLLLASLLLAPARPELRQPGRVGSDPAGRRLLVRDGRRRDAARRRALPVRARGDRLREPARDACSSSRPSARTSTPGFPDRMLLAEANQWPEDAVAYFGQGDECHMAFHFPLDAAPVHGAASGRPLPDPRHHGPDAGHP